MEVCKVLLFVILEIFLVLSAPISKREGLFSWKKHNQRLRTTGFNCSVPQPRYLSYKDFIDTSIIPDVNSDVFPRMTLLHRCDSQTGCCTEKNEVCSRYEYENVTLVFQIHTVMPDKSVDYKFESVIARNHTECRCTVLSNRPK